MAQGSDILETIVGDMLASEAFSRSDMNRRLLQYLVDEVQAGRQTRISEYAVAQDVFQRDDSFDPGSDPIVRVRMRRLRQAIDRYNATLEDGAARLVLPNNQYAPELVMARAETVVAAPADTPPKTAPRRWVPLSLLAAAAALCLALAYTIFAPETAKAPSRHAGYPIIRIEPFENLTDDPQFDYLERGFQQQIAADLQRFGQFRIEVAPPEAPETTGPKSPRADFVMEGLVLAVTPDMDIVVRLKTARDGAYKVDRRLTQASTDSYGAVLASISAEVSGLIAGAGGDLANDALAQETGWAHPFRSGLPAFRCVLMTNDFLRDYEIDRFVEATRCIEAKSDQLERDVTLAAAWGTLRMHAVPEFNLMPFEGLPPDLYADADDVRDYAERLAARYPGSDAAQILVGAVRNIQGDTQAAIAALERAQRINPANPTASGVLAYALMGADRLSEARVAAEIAVRHTAHPQPYLFLPIAVSALAEGDTETARTAFAAASEQVGVIADATGLIAAHLSGDRAAKDRYRAALSRMPDVMEVFRGLVRGPEGQAVLAAALREAGVQLPTRPM